MPSSHRRNLQLGTYSPATIIYWLLGQALRRKSRTISLIVVRPEKPAFTSIHGITNRRTFKTRIIWEQKQDFPFDPQKSLFVGSDLSCHRP
uniref:Uncharacterized protein n=1 Tax=Picea glauca TaxID=3330 RepID=A0A101LWM0_PICGL|nr:hypothetical protein ABT39_MTgene1369 [Picea glauca]QHR89478.1 hypothetical protein Q903MT_gene3499 [Picea sitchensis]